MLTFLNIFFLYFPHFGNKDICDESKKPHVHLLNLMSKISTVNVRKEAPTACEYNYSSFNCKI